MKNEYDLITQKGRMVNLKLRTAVRYYRPHEPHILATAWLTLDLTLFPNSLLAKICWEGTQMYFKRRGGQNPYD